MLTCKGFTGINNVLPEHRMGSGDLLLAQDVDIGLTGEVTRRAGLTVASEQCHKNLHQAHSFMLATCGSALITASAPSVVARSATIPSAFSVAATALSTPA